MFGGQKDLSSGHSQSLTPNESQTVLFQQEGSKLAPDSNERPQGRRNYGEMEAYVSTESF